MQVFRDPRREGDTSMLELKDIHYSVDAPEGRTEILRGVSLTIPDKKLIVLTGPNGGGKTTLAKAIMGLVTPTGGSILWNGILTLLLYTHGSLSHR